MLEMSDDICISEEVSTQANSSKKRPRDSKSKTWKYFTKFNDNGLKARCNACEAVFSAKPQSGTSHLSRHVQFSCPVLARDKNQSLLSPSSALLEGGDENISTWKFDHDVSRHELARMIILHELPFSVVDYDGLRRFVRSLNPRFKMVKRNTIRDDCLEMYRTEKIMLKEFFKTSCQRVCLTSDMWTSNQDISYLSVTAHFVDNNWKLQKRIISFSMADFPHPAPILASKIWNCIKEWELESKVLSVTLDNASVNDACIPFLLSNITENNTLVFEGKLFHVRCASHVLNLIVQDGLGAIGKIIHNVRSSVRYVRGSPSRRQSFEKCIRDANLSIERWVCLDVPTRWNSTYKMLETTIQYKKAFSYLDMYDSNFNCAPTVEEWKNAEIVCDFLKVFYNATNVVSGVKYPTSNMYFHEMFKVKLLLDEEASNAHDFIRSLIIRMQLKFNKYWKECDLVLTIPVILDPRYKLQYFEFCFPLVYGNEARGYVEKLDEAIHFLFNDYQASMPLEQESCTSEMTSTSGKVPQFGMDILKGWNQFLSDQARQRRKTELDQYLDEGVLRIETDFDILGWWSSRTSLYPTLSRMARDILAVPASTVASEYAFSTGRRILTDFRSSLLPETVEALICTQDWLRHAPQGTTMFETVSGFFDTSNVEKL